MQNYLFKDFNPENERIKLEITTLGSFSVKAGDVELSKMTPRTGQIWKLFKYIVSNRQTSVPTDSLTNILWPEGECDNPLKALYSLIYRLRNLLNEPFEDKRGFIIFQQNCYSWNPTAPYRLDAEVFEKLCIDAEKAQDDSEKVELYNKAFDIYKGEYLSESKGESWVIPLANYYKRLYSNVVSELCRVYRSKNDYDSVIRICEGAIGNDPYEEGHHAELINALIMKGNISQASAHLDYVTMLMLRDLGVNPSDKLLSLGRHIRRDTENIQCDISTAVNSLTQQAMGLNGAFFCELDVFKRIYQLYQRSIIRTGRSVYLGQFTFAASVYELPDPQILSEAMAHFRKLIIDNLRRSDTVTQYSKSQLLVILPDITETNCEMVLVRLKRKFETTYKGAPIILKYAFSQFKQLKIDNYPEK